ncbi:MAG: uridine phosphorylase [Candidatus Latescibacterota bacterium]|nr:MAG: uridine phosphorylase [Candidatus Latescibacterota bacterium]
MGEQIITRLKESEVSPYVFLCGEPERVPRIAESIGGAEKVRVVREYAIYRASLEGTPVSIASTGVGGPSTAVLVEELANLGAHTFLRVGTSGGMGDDVQKGDFVISTGAIREDGTSNAYVWPSFPAAAHHQAVLALIAAAESLSVRYHVGLTFSVDAFYAENKVLEDGKLVSMCHGGFALPSRVERLRDVSAMGALHIEMENGTLFTLGGIFGLRTGAICTVSDVVPWHPTDTSINFEENIAACIQVGALAMKRLVDWDREKGAAKHWFPRAG